MSKHEQLAELAAKRRFATGVVQVGDFHDGAYDTHDHVSPLTKGAGDVDADVFLLLQDWASAEYLAGPIDAEVVRLGRKPSLPTNVNLARLLRDHLGIDFADTYATNLYPFVKPGGMAARIATRQLVDAAREYALPQIAIVQPRLVVCLGLATLQALQRAIGAAPSQSLALAIAKPITIGGAEVWCQAHTGALGRANRNRGGVDRVAADWMRMRAAIRLADPGRSAVP